MSYTIVGFDPDTLDDPIPCRVSTTYDRSIRSYVTILEDENGYQIGDAMYDGTRADRDVSVATLTRGIE